MPDHPVVDVHAHVSETAAIGEWSTAGYEIWEYGEKPDVAFGHASGTIADLLGAMEAGGLTHAVIVNAFSVDEIRGRWLAGVDVLGDAAGVRTLDPETAPPLGERLIAFNEWLVAAVSSIPRITPFIAVDPWVLEVDELIAHLEVMQTRGARGVKLHPNEQRCFPSDPRLLRVWRACADLGLTVLSHSGPDRDGFAIAEPSAFAAALDAVPGLRLVVAHLGGASWEQVRAFAGRYATVAFDLSEIVAWLGAPNAPDADQLVALVREVGVERVMFGSDFPWYDPGVMAGVVRRLPGLGEGEIDAILGENAVRILDLPI